MNLTNIIAGALAATLSLSFIAPASAQSTPVKLSPKHRYKQVSGRYGNMDGICLFEDGKFLLYGYATAVFGKYNFEKDYILFYPDKPERFAVYAWKNKHIGDSTRMYFQGFESGATFIQLDKAQAQRVFNEDANCFNAPFIHEAAKVPAQISLFDKAEEEVWYTGKATTAWHYNIDKGYNDFMFLYNKPQRYYNDFSGRVEQTSDGTWVLKLSANFGDRALGRSAPEEEDANWQEILQWKSGYDQSGADTAALYANKLYNVFNTPDSLNYTYDAALDEYVNILNKDNDSFYQDNAYGDDRYLRKYVKLHPGRKDDKAPAAKDLAATTVFYTVCGGEEQR